MLNITKRTKNDWEKKKIVESTKAYSKKKKIKRGNMVVNDIKIFVKMKANVGLLQKNYEIKNNSLL